MEVPPDLPDASRAAVAAAAMAEVVEVETIVPEAAVPAIGVCCDCGCVRVGI